MRPREVVGARGSILQSCRGSFGCSSAQHPRPREAVGASGGGARGASHKPSCTDEGLDRERRLPRPHSTNCHFECESMGGSPDRASQQVLLWLRLTIGGAGPPGPPPTGSCSDTGSPHTNRAQGGAGAPGKHGSSLPRYLTALRMWWSWNFSPKDLVNRINFLLPDAFSI